MCLALCCMFILAPGAKGQVTTADVLGTVTDTTGAVVPGAAVTLTNVGTGVMSKAISNGTGNYLFTLLIPGKYSVTVEAQGFKKVTITGIAVAAGDRAREDAKLETGAVEETVEVTSSAPLFQTDSASVSSVVTEQTVQDLPLNGRNYVNLVQLQPGVNQGSPSAISSGARPDDRRQSATIVANGQSDLFNDQMIEGMDNNEREQGLIGVRPSIDAIAEVKVDTNAFNAEVGRSAGAVVNIITKSGTNDYHGTAYEYFRNDIFDAREFFTRKGVTDKPEYRQNQFGGSIGGPIVKNRTFFFGDVEDNRNILGVSSGEMTVPTLHEYNNIGDFSDVGGPTVKESAMNAVGLAYYKMFPKPNVSDTATTNNYISVAKKTQYAFSADGRIDHNFKNGDTLFGRYSYNNISTTLPGFFPSVTEDSVTIQPGGSLWSFDGPSTNKAHGVQFNYAHLFTPNLVMELKTGYTRIDIDTESLNHGKDVSSAIGVVNANTTAAPGTSGLMPVTFSTGSYASLGDSPYLPIQDRNNTFQYMGAITYTRGNHSFKIGQQITRRQLNYFQNGFGLGYAIFYGLTGNSLADLLTGYSMGYMRSNLLIQPGFRAWETGTYVQDNWRVSSRLTLNLGLRYEIYTPISEAHNRYANFDYPNLKLILGTEDAHVGINTNYANFSPRLGFSQQVTSKTLVRGGFGMSYYPTAIQGQIQSSNPPYQYAKTCIPCIGYWPTLPVPTASSTTDLSGNLVYETKDFNTAYVEQFNLMLQQEFGENVLTVGGVGELGRHMLFQPTANLPDPAGPYSDDATTGPSAAPALLTASALPNVGTIQEDSARATTNYYGMQAVFARRFAKGLAFNINYTWAHGLSDAVSGSSALSDTGLLPRNAHYDYGNSAVDIRHRIALNWNYAVPFGKDKHGLIGVVEKGWTWNGVLFWQSGQPFSVTNSWTNTNSLAQINLPDTTSDRPDVTGKAYRVNSSPSISNWLNLEAFTPQQAGTAGNERSGQIYGPHSRRADISLFKNFDLPRKTTLQFRAECYNISNTPNFGAPNAAISSWTEGSSHSSTTPISKVGLLPGDTPTSGTTFGTITSTASGLNPRQMQFALKLMF